MVGTHPQHLLTPHQDAVEVFDRVEEDLDVAHSTFLPLVKVSVPAVQLGPFLEEDLLLLLTRLCLHLRHDRIRETE